MARSSKKKPAIPMIVFSQARDIPFNRIALSDSNVREVDVEAGLDELTSDIERREDLVQGLNVRAILDADGSETGDFETPAGGRRYRSIARLVKTGRFPKDGLVPCIVKKADAKTSAVDDSLAENSHRLALHPLDQFKAFKRMVDGGMTSEEVANAYFTTARYIEQRLALAKVSPVLHEIYAQDGMTLAMLEAFTSHPDHDRQEQVWDVIQHSHNSDPWRIRQMLTEAPFQHPTSARSLSASTPMSRRAVQCCATCSIRTMAAGCKTRRYWTSSLPTNSRPSPTRSRTKAGSGSLPLATCHTAMSTTFAH